MSKMARVLRYANTLSLDVSAGAVVGACCFAAVWECTPKPTELVCLGLTVWLIYTVDRLLDAYRARPRAATYRHRFHQRHFTSIGIAALLSLLAIVTLLFFLRPSLLISGGVLLLFVAAYLCVQHKIGACKELFAAALYTVGIALPSVSLGQGKPSLWAVLFAVLFALTAGINLVLFSLLDCRQDRLDRRSSIAVILGKKTTTLLLYLLFAIQLVLVAYCVAHYLSSFLLILVLSLMNAVLFALFVLPRRFTVQDGYRTIGDAVFLFPLLYLLV